MTDVRREAETPAEVRIPEMEKKNIKIKPRITPSPGSFFSVLFEVFYLRKREATKPERSHHSNLSTESLFCFIPFENLYYRGHCKESHNESG